MSRARVPVGVLALLATIVTAQGQEQLIERTVAVVGGAVITLSDVRTAVTLNLVDTAGPQPLEMGAKRLIERALMLHEVARFAPPEPKAEVVQAQVAAIVRRAGSEDALAAVLSQGAFSRARLTQWIRDDLRIAAYLDQRFAAAGVPSEGEVDAEVRARADDDRRQGLAEDEARARARARLLADRRGRMIAEWLAELRRRTDVVEFPLP